MEIILFLLGAVVGSIFYSVIKGLTRKIKTKQQIEDEIEYCNQLTTLNEDYKKGLINGFKWVLNK